MSKVSCALLLVAMIFATGCKEQSSSAGADVRDEEALSSPFAVTLGGNYLSVDAIRNQAKALIDDRISKDNDPQASITFAYWYPEFVFNKTMSAVDQYQGFWIKFEDDFSYRYGKDGKTFGSGRYHYRLSDGILAMVDDNAEIEPKFWKVQHNGKAMALIGEHDLGINNGMQIKLLSLDQAPM